MVVVEGIAEAAPFAADWRAVAGVKLNIDLGMSCSNFSASLNRAESTKQRTTVSSV